jgi:hypothetical protein
MACSIVFLILHQSNNVIGRVVTQRSPEHLLPFCRAVEDRSRSESLDALDPAALSPEDGATVE